MKRPVKHYPLFCFLPPARDVLSKHTESKDLRSRHIYPMEHRERERLGGTWACRLSTLLGELRVNSFSSTFNCRLSTSSRSSRLTRFSMTQPPHTIPKHLRLPRRPPRILRMRQVRRNAPNEMQKHGSGMFVRRNRFAKRHVPQILQRIG